MTDQLTPHFALAEFACKCGCGGEKAPIIRAELTKLCATILEPLRAKLSVPLSINSGFRCPKHNKAIGGASQSYHMRGMAADVVAKGKTPQQVALAASDLPAGGLTAYPTFTHLDTRKGRVTWNAYGGPP